MNAKPKVLCATAPVDERTIWPLPNSHKTHEECAMEHKHGIEAEIQHRASRK
jgi:glutamate synthase (NADPH/NADH) large chain